MGWVSMCEDAQKRWEADRDMSSGARDVESASCGAFESARASAIRASVEHHFMLERLRRAEANRRADALLAQQAKERREAAERAADARRLAEQEAARLRAARIAEQQRAEEEQGMQLWRKEIARLTEPVRRATVRVRDSALRVTIRGLDSVVIF